MSSGNNPNLGRIWIHNYELKKNKCHDKNTPIPSGWKVGRVFDWAFYLDRELLKTANISISHLSKQGKELFKQHRTNEIIELRKDK